MYEYSHGGNAVFEHGNEGVIDLSANMNPLGMPESVIGAIIREIPNCTRYPDSYSRKLREKIAWFENVGPDWIFCGSGASDVIFRLPRAVHAKKVMVTAPTFSDYERSALSNGSEIIHYMLSPEKGFSLDSGFIEAVRRAQPDMVFICNPNNPTGRLTEARLMEKLLGCCQQIGAVAVVDECFLNFTAQGDEYASKVFLDRYPNLVILNAFTKLFALPGVRLGYAICADKALIDSLYFHGADWPVSNLAQAAGIAALEVAVSFIEKTKEYVSAERTVMEKELIRLGYKVYPSKANYLFLQNPYAFDLREEIDRMAIRIRSCGNYRGLDDSYFRIAVSTKENNEKLLTAMNGITIKYTEGSGSQWK
jgi:threonine-phosphate decarboxylase